MVVCPIIHKHHFEGNFDRSHSGSKRRFSIDPYLGTAAITSNNQVQMTKNYRFISYVVLLDLSGTSLKWILQLKFTPPTTILNIMIGWQFLIANQSA